jgi:glycosyl transferase family 25
LSHFAILRNAADAGKSVLILEDDCDFILPQAIRCEPPEECDVFYGGYAASDPTDPHNSDIIGSHFMGFSAKAASVAVSYLTDYLRPDFKGDPRAASEPGYNPNVRPGIDGAYVWLRRAHPELVTVFEQLSVQRSSRTDIGFQRWFDRAPLIRDLAQWGRRVARHLPESMRPIRQGNVFN